MSRKRETYGSISRAIRELLEKQEQEKKPEGLYGVLKNLTSKK